MVCGLTGTYWQAPFTWEPVYHPSLGLENKGLFSFLISLPATTTVLSSVLHTAARVIFLKCRAHHDFALFKTLQ